MYPSGALRLENHLRRYPTFYVLVDIVMPDIHRLEALNRTREMSLTTPVIILTGLAEHAIGFESLRRGPLKRSPWQGDSSLLVRCHVYCGFRTVSLAKKTGLTIPQVLYVRFFEGLIHSDHIHRAVIDAYSACGTQVVINVSYPHVTPLLFAASKIGCR
jgi:hypothetical protein